MDVRIETSTGIQQFARYKKLIGGANFHRQVARAMNHAAAKSRTSIGKEARRAYRVRSRDVKATVTAIKARPERMQAGLRSSGKPLPVDAFRHNQTRKGVSARIMGTRKVIHKAFRTPDGKVRARGVYKGGAFQFRYKRENKGGADMPITRLLTAAAPHILADSRVTEGIENKLSADFQVRLTHLLQREAGKLGF